MIGLGTLINTVAVGLGGIIGTLFGGRIQERFQDSLMKICGICVVFIGAAGAFQEMLTLEGGKLQAGGSMMLIASMGIGGLLGEAINIEYRTEAFGEWLRRKTRNEGDTRFVDGFVITSLTVCVGAMAVLGPIKDGLYGDISILLTKSILDFIIVVVLAASYGKGCTFAALPILLMEGSVTLLARYIEPFMTVQALSNLSLVGSVLIACVGINLVFGKTVKVANLLPALVVAVLYAFLPL